MADKKKPKPDKKSTKKVMDVARPGKSAPSASSRPVIVGHKPTVKDPMVSEDKKMPDNEPDEHKIEVKRNGPKVIEPLSSAEELSAGQEASAEESDAATEQGDTPIMPEPETEAPAPETSEDKSAEESSADESDPAGQPEEEPSAEEPAAETEAAEPEADSEPAEPEAEEPAPEADAAPDKSQEPGKGEKDQKSSNDKSSSVVDAVVGQAAKSKEEKEKEDKKNEELQKRQAEIDKLVEEKKYFVHTSTTTKKERKTRWLVLLVSVLLLAGAYLALDAQLVKNDCWLPYEFFKEQQKSINSIPVDSNDSTAASKQATSESVSKEEFSKGVSVKLGDLIQYTNKTLGVSFSYPKDWGEISIRKQIILDQKGNEVVPKSGEAFSINFSADEKIVAGFVTTDFKIDKSDASYIGFTKYESCEDASAKYVYTYLEEEKACLKAIVTKDSDGSNGYQVNLQYQKELINGKYSGIEFNLAIVAVTTPDETGVKAALPESYYGPKFDFVRTIKQL